MRFIAYAVFMLLSCQGWAKLKVVATTADIAALAREVGGELVEVSAIAKGSQDPHYIEPKPSFMVKIRDANLLIANGLSLEIGWLPSLIHGARNPKVLPNAKGYIELGSLIEPLDIPKGSVTRAQGDVHPEGNPHFMLDPVLVGHLAEKLALKFAELDSANAEKYKSRAKSYQEAQTKKTIQWKSRIEKSGVKKVITYHPSLNYFLKRFNLVAPLYIEAKPGIPPSAQHILELIETMKKQSIRHILVDSFFDTKVADRIAKEVPGTKVKSVGISVEALPNLKKLEDVTEQLVQAIEDK